VLAVLPLGDSITYGLSLGQQTTPGGYRGFLSADLSAAGVAHRFVGTTAANPPAPGATALDPSAFLHDGWPGARVDQVHDAVVGASPLDGGSWFTDTPTRPALDPDVVVVHLGTNDIGQAYDPGWTYPGGYDDADPAERAVFAAHLGERIVSLVRDLRALRPGTAVVVCTLVPMPGDTDAALADVVRTRVVPQLDQPGAPAVLADLAAELPAGFGTDPALTADGVHPTAAGYEAMAAVLARAVVEVAG
jgi:lysophospholipase L1-like esterase